MPEFRMPSLGADMQTGLLVEWNVKPGDQVRRGDIIAVVETDKGDIEVEVYEDGIVDKLLVNTGTSVPVGTLLATLLEPETSHPKPEEPAKGPSPKSPQPMPIGADGEPGTVPAEATQSGKRGGGQAVPPRPPSPGHRIPASPSARRLARELGVELSAVNGTGPHGVVTRADIERAAEAGGPPPEAPARAESPGTAAAMRRAIAAAMTRSNRDIPHYYLETSVDLHRSLQWLEEANRALAVEQRILPAALLLKAVALSLQEVPELNGYWIEDQHRPQDAVNVGLAISLRQGGLVIPALHNADLKSLAELMESMRDLITRARSGRLRSSELTDSTITVTNLGDLGVETVYGVIYPPQVALVGFGKILEQPWAQGGMLGIRPVVRATLAADHRATDGRRGAQFLDNLNRHLQKPETL